MLFNLNLPRLLMFIIYFLCRLKMPCLCLTRQQIAIEVIEDRYIPANLINWTENLLVTKHGYTYSERDAKLAGYHSNPPTHYLQLFCQTQNKILLQKQMRYIHKTFLLSLQQTSFLLIRFWNSIHFYVWLIRQDRWKRN